MKKSLKNLGVGVLFTVLLARSVNMAMAAAAMPLGSSTAIPAAQGDARVRTTQNGNTEVRLRISHLAPPGRIVSGAEVFVVWLRGQAPGDEVRNMGALKVNDKLNAKFTATTPMKSFDMFITCEQSQTVTLPDSLELLPFHYESK